MISLIEQKVAIVGGGQVGSTLALALQKAPSPPAAVTIAARNPEKTLASLKEKGISDLLVEKADVAIPKADVLILATPGPTTKEGIVELAQSLGNVAGKAVIDTMNPVTSFPELNLVLPDGVKSCGELLQEALPDSKVYKAFNTLGVMHMADAAGKDMLFAGPDDGIDELVAAVGYKPYYVGPIRYAKNLENMAELWIHCAIPPLPGNNLGNDWTFGIAGNPMAKKM